MGDERYHVTRQLDARWWLRNGPRRWRTRDLYRRVWVAVPLVALLGAALSARHSAQSPRHPLSISPPHVAIPLRRSVAPRGYLRRRSGSTPRIVALDARCGRALLLRASVPDAPTRLSLVDVSCV